MRLAAIAVTVKPFTTPTTPKLTHYSVPSTTTTINPLKLNSAENPEFSWTPLKYDSLFTHSNSAKLAKNCMEYQGINNWEGLLDPLDDTLRSEILRYGQFVEAAYRSFDFDTSSPTYATCKFPKSSLLSRSCIGGTGYKPTKNLRATCGIQLPRWIQRGPSWLSTQSSWIGYVAVCQDKEEIARLGRRDVVIAFRGTATCLEWLENLRATLTSLPDDEDNVVHKGSGAMVGSGFMSLYTSGTTTCPSLQNMVREEIGRILEIYGDEPLSLTITGHSLGAALATLAAQDINSNFNNAPMVTVISFGGPRVGNQNFRHQLEKSGTKILRIVNSDDLITKVPGFVIDNNDMADQQAVKVAGLPNWVQKRVEDTQLGYADVGQELRLSEGRPEPESRERGNCHDLARLLGISNGLLVQLSYPATARRVLSKHHREKLAMTKRGQMCVTIEKDEEEERSDYIIIEDLNVESIIKKKRSDQLEGFVNHFFFSSNLKSKALLLSAMILKRRTIIAN
ncbi:phospholipase A(1) DAD1, chloroplastic-like [Durio zibethinus]|uniref:Phospholipase A(1) DAD1, chloroplastic-like n=1 Tax=Durio zibethinus TaxID=66656 RepID=A0A6P6A403_DURZI|nr:phospholipase A(1) DAD1, chloroplastic-like [Durio zibethinus]